MKTTYRAFLAFVLVGGLVSVSFAKDPRDLKDKNQQTLQKSAQTKTAAILNINNFTTWQRAGGLGQYGPPSVSGDGGVFPRGTRWVLYADGFVWSAKAYTDAAHTQVADGQLIRTGGNTYNEGNEVGWIQGSGATAVASGAANSRSRIYRIRRDWTTMSETELRLDAAENLVTTVDQVTSADIDALKAQYAKDWDEWPVDLGAPYIERNGTPGYQKPHGGLFDATFTVDSLIGGNYDEPGLAGSDPSSPANQVVWTVMNDLNVGNMNGFAGSKPMGLEAQLTLWGYKRSDALGNLYFKKIRFINKGGASLGGGATGSLYLDSMYFCQWSDPDLGAFGDDLAGCDTVLSMGFVYNGSASDAEFVKFNLPPPAVGYDFLQGPMVAGAATDTAVFNLQKRGGFKNLPMTSFAWFAAGAAISDPPFSYEGALRWNRMLRGYVPDPSTNPERLYPSGPFPPSNFPLSGEPNSAQTGFVDGIGNGDWSFSPGDRRIVLATGPFNLAPGDTQEVVVGVVAGLGGDRFSSVAVMKANDAAVQTTYDLLFQVSQPPANPNVAVTELDGKVILDWGTDLAQVKKTETEVSQPGNYNFEGYNIYQMPSASSPSSEWRRIATYDVANATGVVLDAAFDPAAGQILSKPIQFGTNSGIQRTFQLDRDYVSGVDKLYNGQEYYVAVTAYSVAQDPGFVAALESTPIVHTVVPKRPYGTKVNSAYGDAVPVTRKSGISDGSVQARVVSPTQLTGHDYEVRFQGGGAYSLVDVTASPNKTVFSGQTNQNADAASPIGDGMQILVSGAPNDYKYILAVANAGGALNPPDMGTFAFNSNGFPLYMGSDRPSGSQQTNGSAWGIVLARDADPSYSRFLARTTQYSGGFGEANMGIGALVPYDYEIRFTAGGSVGLSAFGTATEGQNINLPFELWNIGLVGDGANDPSDDFQIYCWILDDDANGAFNLNAVDHAVSGGTNDPQTDRIYMIEPLDRTPGSAGYTALRAAIEADTTAALLETLWAFKEDVNYHSMPAFMRMGLVNWNGGDVTDPSWPANVNALMPETGTIFRIVLTKPNTAADVFVIKTDSVAGSKTLAQEKQSVENISVYPNPYYAYNPAETNRFVRFVTFTNLPTEATVRIFNLAGQLVRTIRKNDATTQFLRWDLTNHDNFPVASGMYIAHLDLKLSDGSTATKVLKLAIIQEQEVPDVF